ncbi:MAG: beta-ketoacyl-ACP synthase II [Bacteroidota bacterium]
MTKRRVVVTGLGALTPIGKTASDYWNGLVNGVSGAATITRFDAAKFKTQFACEVKNFDVKDYIDRREARRMDPFCHYGVIVSDEAIADAGLNDGGFDPMRFGVVLGSGIGGITTFQSEVRDFFAGDGTPRFNPFFIPKMIIDIVSGHVSMKYGLKGPNYSCVSACATSSNCIADAFMLIRTGLADLMLAGGSEAAVTEAGIGGFNAMKALSTRNDDPKTASRPFDADRDGFVLGEGGGAIVLESYEHAVARGAKIYAEITGIGLTADAHHITAPHPEGEGARRVMTQCLEVAGLQPSDVDYVNVHGTSTPLGDIAETKAIKQVFGEHAPKLNISSTKSMTGHLLGAAGAIEAIASILSIHHGVIPPTINHFTDDPDCDLNYTFNQTMEREVNHALSNTFGFGGHNASLIFSKVQ